VVLQRGFARRPRSASRPWYLFEMTKLPASCASGLGARVSCVSIRDAARDLNELLAGLEVQPPYVMVCHSLGGMDAIMFAMMHPDAVAGMVLKVGSNLGPLPSVVEGHAGDTQVASFAAIRIYRGRPP